MDPVQIEERIIAAKNGDQQALAWIIEYYAESVHGFIYSVIGKRQYVEDLAQDTFIKMISGIKTFELKAPFRSWLFRIALNVCRDHIRRKRVRNIVTYLTKDNTDYEIPIIDYTQNPEIDLDSSETLKQIQQILQNLPEPLKVVFLMRDVQELTYEEISDALKWKIGTVKSRLFRARKEIARLLNQYQD